MDNHEHPPKDIASLLNNFTQQIRELRADLEQQDAADSERASEHAKKARKGDLGPDWKVIQLRIDAGATTLDDVFSGADTTPPARRLRELSQKNLTELRKSWEEHDKEQAGKGAGAKEPSPLAQMKGIAAESHRHHEKMMRLIRDQLNRQ